MGDAPYPIRPISETEFLPFWDVLEESFHETNSTGMRDAERALVDFPRTLAAFDGDRIIATGNAYDFRMAVPGGLRPVAGVTLVGVLPAYRRRGVLGSLMRRQLADLSERGEAVAALFASEAVLYGRYGYGIAARQAAIEIRRGETRYLPGTPADDRLRTRTADLDEVWPQLAKVYDAQLADRPGQFARSQAWWHQRRQRRDPRDPPLRCVLVEDEERVRGYALFTLRQRWDRDGLPDSRLDVAELHALDPAAYAAVWRHLLDRDLVSIITAESRPVDDPILHLLEDPRRLRMRQSDNLWVRLVNVDRALTDRSYRCGIDVVIEVDDPVCPWNSGRWHLAAEGTDARCERTTRPADIALPVRVLGAAYLGGVGLGAPARAGLVRELRTGALDALSHALAWDPAPWCPIQF